MATAEPTRNPLPVPPRFHLSPLKLSLFTIQDKLEGGIYAGKLNPGYFESLNAKKKLLLRAHAQRRSLRATPPPRRVGDCEAACRMRRPPEFAAVAAVAVFAALVLAAGAGAAPLPAALRLERALPHKGVAVEHLRERDRARHGRRGLLGGGGGGVAGVVDFPVEGSANPFMVGWVSCLSLSFSCVLYGCGCV